MVFSQNEVQLADRAVRRAGTRTDRREEKKLH